MAKTSQAQLDATRRWREKNKARVTYSDYRLALNTFVAGKGKLSEIVGSDVQTSEYINDLEVLYEMVSERIKELEQCQRKHKNVRRQSTEQRTKVANYTTVH